MQRMSAQLWPSQKQGFMNTDPQLHVTTATALAGQGGWTSLYETVAEEEEMVREQREKRRERMIYGAAFGALLMLVGLLMFLLWPRMPSARVVDLTFDDGADLSQPLGSRLVIMHRETSYLPEDFPGTQREFLGVRLRVEIRIVSNNFVPLPVDDIELLVKAEGVELGAGRLEHPIKLNPRGRTRASIPVDLVIHDPHSSTFFIDLLRNACSPDPEARKLIALDYSAVVHVNLLESLRVQPPNLHGLIDLDCPWDIDEAMSKSNSNSTLKLGRRSKIPPSTRSPI